MPRTARASVGNVVYHVINRGNAKNDVFHKRDDYAAFLKLINEASDRLPMRLIGYCLMTNHFHLVLWPHNDGDLSRWMQWLMTSHVRRYHRHYNSSGHVWQGRFKAFPIQQDEHLLTVLRYVERNPVRARMVRKAQRYLWSSVSVKVPCDDPPKLDVGPYPRGSGWLDWVNEPQTEAELSATRNCVNRGAPFGSDRNSRTGSRSFGRWLDSLETQGGRTEPSDWKRN